MDVFVRRLGQGAFRETITHLCQTSFDLLAFLESENACAPQRHRPCLRQANVVRPETEIRSDRAIECFKGSGCGNGESSAPQLMRFLLASHDAQSCQDAASTGASSAADTGATAFAASSRSL